jgi:uncharacterized RDD family membrane protein YckC
MTVMLHPTGLTAGEPAIDAYKCPCVLFLDSLLYPCGVGFEDSKEAPMTDSEPRRIGVSIELKPHAYDPQINPELFEGVLARRLIAFVVDLVILAVPIVLGAIFIVASTIATLGIAGILFALLSPLYWPLIMVWAICYYGFTLGSAASATIGMRVMDLEMRTWSGSPCYFVLGAVHAIVFWVTVSFLTPLVLLVGFFNARKRLLHDMLVGTIVINSPARAQMIREARPA